MERLDRLRDRPSGGCLGSRGVVRAAPDCDCVGRVGSVDGVQDAQDSQALRRVFADGTVGQQGRKEKQLTPSTGRELENEGYVSENVQAVGCSDMKC